MQLTGAHLLIEFIHYQKKNKRLIMAILSSTGVSGFLSSAKATGKQILNKAGKLIPEYIEDFVSGFAGHGWKIWERVSGIWRIETDELAEEAV